MYKGKLFEYKFVQGIYLILNTDKEYDEECNWTPWGEWQVCDKNGGILYYLSDDATSNITTVDGEATACFGFWMEEVEDIPFFITKYLKYKTHKE
ncbi:hypothetical protein AT864_00845 [Anoxybacillus sp. P3H1B]|uniref:hypothetical protein n=1 Tax=Anoxybacillaceae TaxID=3120669 RepID=UPI0007959A30|nr:MULTISPECIES: hypothetical protein [Anoxybacillus]KXG10254.1 hypothetical protein AT864_00845 [Anoxybacillus sp. P3H1B]OQM46191.1 hypothetical protein B6A27_08350 [Anoxybacillus sp. UARK-01]